MTESAFQLDSLRAKKSEAQEIANKENKTLMVGCDSYFGYTIVNADDKARISELTDLTIVRPIQKSEGIHNVKEE